MATLQTLRRAGVVAGVGVVALVAAPSASAALSSDVQGGDTTLQLARSTARALAANDVAVRTVRPSRSSRSGITFPITGGSIVPSTGVGAITHSGGLVFSRHGRSLRATSFTIVNRRTARLSARVGRSRVTIATLDLRGIDVERTATNINISDANVLLSRVGAAALNATLCTTIFKRGLNLGSAEIDADLEDLVFTGGSTSLALDAGLVTALGSLGVTPGLVPPAAAGSSGALNFPIVRGKVNAESLAGTITHSGGITLTKGATSVALTKFIIDTSAGQLTALLGGTRVPLLTLDLSAANPAVDGLNVTVGNVKASLTGEAATALNQAFATTAFRAGIPVGTATVAGEL